VTSAEQVDRRRAEGDLVAEYLDSMMLVLRGSGLLAAIAFGGRELLSGGPTDRLRDDLLASLERFDAVRAELGERLYPPLHPEVPDAMRTLRARLEQWSPPEIPDELASAAMVLVSLLASSHVAPAPSPPPSPPREPGVDDLGLPLPRQGMRTFYNAPAKALVVKIKPVPTVGEITGNRIFVRGVGDAQYREVVLPEARLAAQDVIVCADAPLAFVHALRMSSDRSGADDGGIFCIALPDGALRVAVPAHGAGWIGGLLGASPDGAMLHVIAASMHAGSPDSCRAAYCLAALDVATGEMTEIAPLPGVFA